MTYNIGIAILLAILAGVINGSYAAPKKFLSFVTEDTMWLIFFILGCMLIPVINMGYIMNWKFGVLSSLPFNYILILVLGGLLFGIGQLSFALAFDHIGMGINFVINISIGTGLTALSSLALNPHLIFTSFGFFQLAGIILFIIAIMMSAGACILRDKSKEKEKEKKESSKHKKYLYIGIALSIFAGIGSACQGISYAYSNPSVSVSALLYGSSQFVSYNISWLIIFFCAGIPNIIFFSSKIIRNHKRNYNREKLNIYLIIKLLCITIIMALCYWVSIEIFVFVTIKIGGSLAPSIGWPLFCTFIVLTSNFWSIMAGEWKKAPTKSLMLLSLCVVFFLLAVLSFGMSASIAITTLK